MVDRIPVQKMINAMFKQYQDLVAKLHEQYPAAVPALTASSYKELDLIGFRSCTQGPLAFQRSEFLVKK